MFWLLKKIITLLLLAAIVFFAFQAHFRGKSFSESVAPLWENTVVQGLVQKAKDALDAFLPHAYQPFDPNKANGPAMDDVKDDEREELEKEIQKSKH